MKVIVSGRCAAFDKETEEQVFDSLLLRELDGHVYGDGEEDYCFSFWLMDKSDDSPIKNIGISGGFLEFDYDEKLDCLIASVEYDIERELSEEELDALLSYTRGQCSDGIGSNFLQSGCEQFSINVSPMRRNISCKMEL